MQYSDNVQEEIQRRNELSRQADYLIAKISSATVVEFMKKTWGERLSARHRLSTFSSHMTIAAIEFNELCMPWTKRKIFSNKSNYSITTTVGGEVRTLQPGESVEL